MHKASFNFSSPVLQTGIIICILLTFFLIYSCVQREKSGDGYGADSDPSAKAHKFVGDQTCQSCHAYQWEEWKGSHHDYAIAEANEESVRGDFENVSFKQGENSYRFFRDGERYLVDVSEGEAETITHEIVYTFGWEPLQQYLIDIGQGKMQALHIAWDTEKNLWYSLQPDEEYEPGDWMHWTGGSMNWNTMCADCHSTNLRQNYIAEADSFHTTWSVLNVSCEACHGPGADHVEFVNSEEGEEATKERIRKDLLNTRFTSQIDEINTCAPCHSLRQKLTDDYIHGDYYLDHYDLQVLHPELYFADGQIQEEVYVLGSFLQSKMYSVGVQCTDCHNPHTLQLKESLTDNKLCMQCHEPAYNTPDHHFHEANTEGSQCINCHMTGQTYMGNDYRRDHSFRIPRPDQSVQFGTPNSCNNCHTDQSASWAAKAVSEWHGPERPDHFTDILLRANAGEPADEIGLRELIADPNQPEIIRATGVWYVGRYPGDDSIEILTDALRSESALVRNSAAKAMENLPPDRRKPILESAVADSVRAVRISTMSNLVGFSPHDFTGEIREHFQSGLEEYQSYLNLNQYFPQGQMNRARFYEQQGDLEKAMEAYRKTLETDPYFNAARINLAYLHNRLGENARAEELLIVVTEQEPNFGDAYYSLGLLMAEQNRLDESIVWFEQAAELMPGHARLFYNLAVAHQTLENYRESEEAYLRAIEIEPQNGDFRYGLISLYLQNEQLERALEQAQILNQIIPNNQQIEQLLQSIQRDL